jgi:hypothetical protein
VMSRSPIIARILPPTRPENRSKSLYIRYRDIRCGIGNAVVANPAG